MSEVKKERYKFGIIHEELPEEHVDPLIKVLHRVIRFSVKLLAHI
ncbi:MAG: hypothetical protein R3250_14115 [Melioribacteraceae bacterium]|nr:hypothetical protein [Melioribacteraceae bacterium]